MESEIEYLKKLVNDIKYQKERFDLHLNSEKKLEGGSGLETNFFEISSFYKSIIDLDCKIKFSLKEAIKLAYSKEIEDGFLWTSNNEVEEKCYYYIENTIFRVVILWDLLAQIYNMVYSLKKPLDKIQYKKFFENNEKLFNVDNINEYIKEIDNVSGNEKWKGNHKFISKYRNIMTHRYSPNLTLYSDECFNIKSSPRFVLKRITEEYSVVSSFIIQIINSEDVKEISKKEKKSLEKYYSSVFCIEEDLR